MMSGLFKNFQRIYLPLMRSRLFATAPLRSQWDLQPGQRRVVGGWLLGCSAMCLGAVYLGGITRLTESGLSMVDWHLIKGMRPPITEADWEKEFANVGEPNKMTMSDFKRIWYMEYAHRMWGRTIGVAYFVPLGIFAWRGWLSRGMKVRSAIYGSLLVGQGLLGWYMVRSGLEDRPDNFDIPRVSPYRLAAHLGSALVLFSGLFWAGLGHFYQPTPIQPSKQLTRLRIMSHSILTMIFITALSGAFVAGLDAGLVYNSWPKMADRWIPTDLFALQPRWRNLFENATCSQFVHRHLAELTVAFIGTYWLYARKCVPGLTGRPLMATNLLLGMSLVQATIGIAALLTYVPIWMAALHQQGATLVLTAALWTAFCLRKLPK